MKIAMLARNPDLYSHQRICEAAEARGHEIDIINTTRCYMNMTSHKPQIYYQGQPLEGYEAVIPRIGASITFYSCAVVRQFDMLRSNHGPVVMEVNSTPGLEGIEDTSGVDVAGKMIEFIEKNAKPNKTGTRGKG